MDTRDEFIPERTLASPVPVKRPYEAPRLITHGTVADLTANEPPLGPISSIDLAG